jgi:hypothetical protein
VGLSEDPARRLAIVEKARKALAEWPAAHYNYKRDEIQQMVAVLDEAIASLRAASGSDTFDLTLVAAGDPSPSLVPIIPAPGPREVIEQTVRAAQLTTSPAERVSLLTVALNELDGRVVEPASRLGERDAPAGPRDRLRASSRPSRKYRGIGVLAC